MGWVRTLGVLLLIAGCVGQILIIGMWVLLLLGVFGLFLFALGGPWLTALVLLPLLAVAGALLVGALAGQGADQEG